MNELNKSIELMKLEPKIGKCMDVQAWAKEQIKIYDEKVCKERLEIGKRKKCVWTVFLGEFGHRCISHVREVYFTEATEKIVCLPKDGNYESLYPGCKFDYDFPEIIPDCEKQGTYRQIVDITEYQKKYPDYQIMQSGGKSMTQEWILCHPETRIPFSFKTTEGVPKVDVVLATRKRGFIPAKNFQGMQEVANTLKANGYTYATLGKEGLSHHLDGEEYFSANVDVASQLLKNAKLFFAQDSGSSHLTALIGCDLACLTVPDIIMGRTTYSMRTFFHIMKEINWDHNNYEIERELWYKPKEVATTILNILKEKK